MIDGYMSTQGKLFRRRPKIPGIPKGSATFSGRQQSSVQKDKSPNGKLN